MFYPEDMNQKLCNTLLLCLSAKKKKKWSMLVIKSGQFYFETLTFSDTLYSHFSLQKVNNKKIIN